MDSASDPIVDPPDHRQVWEEHFPSLTNVRRFNRIIYYVNIISFFSYSDRER